MPQLRKDPIIGRWVIVSTERARRPGNFVTPKENSFVEDECPFCESRESKTPPEIYAVRGKHHPHPNTPGWQVRVIPSINPMLRIEGDLTRRGRGLYDVMSNVGAHEVIVETPKHIANMADLEVDQIKLTLETYILRINDLEKDPRFQYVIPFKNYGWSAGGGKIRHSRSQIIATPVNPWRVKEELAGAKKYFEYRERCIYCDLIRQECESKERIVVEQEHFVAVTPFASRFPFEVWILPKKHSCDFAKGLNGLQGDLAKILKKVLLKIKVGLNDPSYNYVIHSAPFHKRTNTSDWKTVEHDFHWHIEVMPRLTHVAGFEKGTGFYICSMPPEDTAEYLRGVEV
ncbi:MAG TPA: galactose-1-phosphate uridylyltransferase [Candidatus Omnitrophota bacterium]|nr:galactose-1-phosphate uridylyltransferase [Candidatus Omnitrophota bacterium]HPD84122.1 galactose-1-phosphate uridylyltransferase [Candidatus Omnitrophota bacterium]HRZ02979.1 galactose-1-phosphate uridylyltransferase [Candidatus Omnitrophota bacterium]